MKFEALKEENATSALVKSKTNQNTNNKSYINYNNNNNRNLQQQQQQQQSRQQMLQQHMQQQHKTRNFPKMKVSNSNGTNKNNTNNNKYHNVVHYGSGNYAGVLSKNLRSTNYENNFLNNNNNNNRCVSSAINSPHRNNTNTSRTTKPGTIANTQYRYKSNNEQQVQQQQQIYNYSNNQSIDNLNGPVATAVFTSSWRNRHPNITSTVTTASVNSTNNDNNNNVENTKSCCNNNTTPLTAPLPVANRIGVTLTPTPTRNRRYSSTIFVKEFQQSEQKENLNLNSPTIFKVTTAEAGTNSTNSTKSTTTVKITNSRSINQLALNTVAIANISRSEKQQQQYQQRPINTVQSQLQQSAANNDCSAQKILTNSLKTQTTTARTKSSPNSSSSASSSPLPPFSETATGSGNNNSSIQEYGGTKGVGGGGKNHHTGRKKFWKIPGAGLSATTASTGSVGSIGSGGATGSVTPNSLITNDVAVVADATVEKNNTSNINKLAVSSKSNHYKSNRGHRYQQQQYPESWKKIPATMSTTLIASVTNTPPLSTVVSTSSSTTSVTATLSATKFAPLVENSSATSVKSNSNFSTTNSLTTYQTVPPNATTSNKMTYSATTTASAKGNTKEKVNQDVEKSKSDDKMILENKTPHIISTVLEQQQPQHPTRLQQQHQIEPLSKLICTSNDDSENKSSTSGTPTYSLDFLHSVGKRMAVNGTYPGAKPNVSPVPPSIVPNTAPLQRSNRYGPQNNPPHHHHHHPQPQQLTIASFLQKDMFSNANAGSNGASAMRAVVAGNVGNNNNNATTCENGSLAFNNQNQHQHQRFQNFYNRPQSAPHFYRQQAFYPAYGGGGGNNCNNGNMGPLPNNGGARYHPQPTEHNQHRNNRHQQQQQQRQQQQQPQQQYGPHVNTPGHKNKPASQQSKSPNNQNGSSPSSTSSLSSLTSTASSQTGKNSRHSSGSHKSHSRPNSSIEMMSSKNGNSYPIGTNAGAYRPGNHNRHNNAHHFNQYNHPGPNSFPPGAMMPHQNLNNLTYVSANPNNIPMMNVPHPLMPTTPAVVPNNIPPSGMEPPSRACNQNSTENSCSENSQPLLMNMPARFIPPDQQQHPICIMNTQNLPPVPICPPMINMKTGDENNTSNAKPCNECDDSDCSSSLQSENNNLQSSSSYQHLRPGSALSHASQSNSSQVPSPIDFGFNPILQQLQQPAPMHYASPPYRNGMLPPFANVPPNGFHEDDYHLHGALQQQLPGMFFPTGEQHNGHNGTAFPANTANFMYTNPMMLMTSCPPPASTANSPRSNEEEQLLGSSRSSSSTSEQSTPGSGGSLKGRLVGLETFGYADIIFYSLNPNSMADIPLTLVNDLHEHTNTNTNTNTITANKANSLPSARTRNNRNQHPHHPHLNQHPPMPPPFMHFPFSQQSVFCSNYLAYLRSTPSNTSSDINANTPPDRFMTRSHLVEVKDTPAALLNNSKWDHLSQQIWSKFLEAQQTEETFKSKMRLWRSLYLTIKQTYPRYGLYLVGSTMSGFGADTSDVDMCLVSRSFAFVEQRMEALFNLTILRECLRKTEDFESFNLIEAKVPILRFRDKSNRFEVDLNFNNSVGIKNTHLLYCYTQLDWRLRPLALIVKLWAQYHEINNAKNMTISSYSLVLMVIHFLQCGVNPPVLPCLHKMFPEKFTPLRSNDFGHVDMNDNVGPYESKNTQSVGELFLNFLEYYSSFDYRQNAISVRTGGLLPVSVCRQAKSIKNDVHQWKELCIEEPFDLTNTARSVYDYDTFERVKAVIFTSHQVLLKSLDLNSVFSPLVLPRLPMSARLYMKRRNVSTTLPLITKGPQPAQTVADESMTNRNSIITNEKSTHLCCDNQDLKDLSSAPIENTKNVPNQTPSQAHSVSCSDTTATNKTT